eukprot:8419145-Pyramimonas_sp.AAC.1
MSAPQEEDINAPERQKQGQLDPKFTEKTIKSDFFWGYMHMLFSLHSIAEGLREWSESCPCHYDLLQLSRADRDAVGDIVRGAQTDCQWRCAACPLRGLRAPELAAGSWEDTLD